MEDNIEIPVWDTISGAWQKVSGAKGTVWAAIGVTILIMLFFALFQYVGNSLAPVAGKVVYVIGQIILFLLEMGLVYIGIQRALDKPINFRQIFYAFDSKVAIRVIFAYVLQTLILMIPGLLMFAGVMTYTLNPDHGPLITAISGTLFLLGILAIFFLIARTWLTIAFALENSSPVDAIKKSFAATESNVWRLIGIAFLTTLIIAISMIPLGLGLIWTIPLGIILYGETYRRLLPNAREKVIQLPNQSV